MNRILFDESEVDRGGVVCLSGRRAAHISDVLNPVVGDSLRVGVLNGACGDGQVLSVEPDTVTLRCVFLEETVPEPSIDILLALPRPKVMRRLWAPLASLGVGRILLTNGEKVQRNYFDTHWLQEVVYRPLLIEGLEQSGDTRIPDVTICRRLKPLVTDQLDGVFPDSRRVICHPRDAKPINQIPLKSASRVLLAIGPEGGWSDYEVDLFTQYGFDCISFGWRALRADVACIALIAAVKAARL